MDSAAAERGLRELRAAGRLAEAARLVGQLGPYGVEDGPDGTTSLGAPVLEALGDQLAAAAATSGGEGLARIAVADRIDAKRHR